MSHAVLELGSNVGCFGALDGMGNGSTYDVGGA